MSGNSKLTRPISDAIDDFLEPKNLKKIGAVDRMGRLICTYQELHAAIVVAFNALPEEKKQGVDIAKFSWSAVRQRCVNKKLRSTVTRARNGQEPVKLLPGTLEILEKPRAGTAYIAAYRKFAGLWNKNSAAAIHDLERLFGKSMASIRRNETRMRAFASQHPELHLPPLAWRNSSKGYIVGVPDDVIRELDTYRFPTDQFLKRVAESGGCIISAAQFGAEPNLEWWKTLLNIEAHTGYPLALLPIKYGPVKTQYQAREQIYRLVQAFPEEFNGRMLFDNILLGKGELELNTERARPTLQKFLTRDILKRGGTRSQVFAAPTLEMRHMLRVGRKHTKVCMTTGAVTHPNYAVDNLGQQDRTGNNAAAKHAYAAIIFEFDGRTFHFRQLFANPQGHVYDIDPDRGGAVMYTPSGVEHKPNGVCALYCGDLHPGITDPVAEKATFFGEDSMVSRLRPANIIIGDSFDGWSINRYDRENQAARRVWKAKVGFDKLMLELKWGIYVRREILKAAKASNPNAVIHDIGGNHNDFMLHYLEDRWWAKPGHEVNFEIGAELALEMQKSLPKQPKTEYVELDGERLPKLTPAVLDARPVHPVVAFYRKHTPEIIMYDRQDKLLLPKGVKHPQLLSLHGDMGMRGKETRSNDSLQQIGDRAIVGHNHSAGIWDNIWRVGTLTPVMQHYIMFPKTDWVQANAVVHENGQRQLLHIINGKWYGRKKKNVGSTSVE